MAGFNPFAPQQGGQSKAPQMQGVQAPNVPMQSQPSLMTTLGPTVASKAMGSDAAASAGNYVKDGVKDAWSALTSPSQFPAGSAPVSELSNALVSTPTAQTVGELSANGLMGSTAASAVSAAPAAAAEGLFANGLMGAAAAPAATTAATAGAGLAPAALLAGPFAPLVIGGAMLAANSGK